MKEIEDSDLRFFLAGFTVCALNAYKDGHEVFDTISSGVNLTYNWLFRISDGYFILNNDLGLSNPESKYNENRQNYIRNYTNKLFRVKNQEIGRVLDKLFQDESGKQLIDIKSIYEIELGGYTDLYMINTLILGNLEESVIVKYFRSKAGMVHPYGTGPYYSIS